MIATGSFAQISVCCLAPVDWQRDWIEGIDTGTCIKCRDIIAVADIPRLELLLHEVYSESMRKQLSNDVGIMQIMTRSQQLLCQPGTIVTFPIRSRAEQSGGESGN